MEYWLQEYVGNCWARWSQRSLLVIWFCEYMAHLGQDGIYLWRKLSALSILTLRLSGGLLGRRLFLKKGSIVILSFHNRLDLPQASTIHGNLLNTLELNVKKMLLQVHFDLVFSFSFQANRKTTQGESCVFFFLCFFFFLVSSVDWGDKTLKSYKATTEPDRSYSLELNIIWFLRKF